VPARPTFDLQSHSVQSDGDLAAADVVASAAAAGIELLALTDHDTVDGVDEALGAAKRVGIRLTPAAELSAVHEGHEDLHVLGYGLDHRDGTLARRLADWRGDRDVRVQRMADRLRALGLEVEEAPLDGRRAAGKPLGRPHLAQAVLAAESNQRRLASEGIDDISPLIERYLIPGAPGYLPRSRPTVPEAIAAIHDAGGIAIWAHPFWDITSPDEVLTTLAAFAGDGLDGVEAFYVTHTREQTLLLADAAQASGLLTTGSADFHGPGHRRFSRFGAFDLHGREPVLGPIDDGAVG
jgi:predicted metal-dependent phosphoesterase TrpH